MSRKSLRASTQALLVQNQIHEWRKNKSGQRKMPEELWQKSVIEAKIHGVSAVATFFNIGRRGLLHRMTPELPINKRIQAPAHGFVKLQAMPELRRSTALEVRLTRPDGESAAIHGIASSAEWESLFTGWFRASRATCTGGAL
jgi:hypothetical protein